MAILDFLNALYGPNVNPWATAAELGLGIPLAAFGSLRGAEGHPGGAMLEALGAGLGGLGALNLTQGQESKKSAAGNRVLGRLTRGDMTIPEAIAALSTAGYSPQESMNLIVSAQPPEPKLVPIPGPDGKPVYGVPKAGQPVYEKPTEPKTPNAYQAYYNDFLTKNPKASPSEAAAYAQKRIDAIRASNQRPEAPNVQFIKDPTTGKITRLVTPRTGGGVGATSVTSLGPLGPVKPRQPLPASQINDVFKQAANQIAAERGGVTNAVGNLFTGSKDKATQTRFGDLMFLKGFDEVGNPLPDGATRMINGKKKVWRNS